MSKWLESLALTIAAVLALLTFSGAVDEAAWAAVAVAVAAGMTGFARRGCLDYLEQRRLYREWAARQGEQPDAPAPEVTHGGYEPSRVRHPAVDELDGKFRELTEIDEVRVAVGSVAGVPPSEIWEFAVLVIDYTDQLSASVNVEKNRFDALLHRAHQEMIGGKSSERNDDSDS